MADASSKAKPNTPWRHDTQSIFGRSEPHKSWQVDDIGINDVEDEIRESDDEDSLTSTAELRKKKDARDTFRVSDKAKSAAVASWTESRQQFRHLWDDSCRDLPQQTPALLLNSNVNVDDLADDMDLPHPVETAMVGYLRNNSRHQAKWDVSLKKIEFLNYIAQCAADLVPQMWLVRVNDTEESTVRPDNVVVVGRDVRNGFSELSGIHVLDAYSQEATTLEYEQFQLWLNYSSDTHLHHLTKAKGQWALTPALKYLATLGLHLKSQLERVHAAQLLDGEFESNNLPWKDTLDQISGNRDLFNHMWEVRNHIKMKNDPFPNGFVFAASNVEGRTVGIHFVSAEEAEKMTFRAGALRVNQDEHGREFVPDGRGEGTKDLAFSWISSQMGQPLSMLAKHMAVALWGGLFRTKEKQDAPSWDNLIQSLRTSATWIELWHVREFIRPIGNKMPDEFYISVRSRVVENGKLFSAFRVFLPHEMQEWGLNNNSNLVHVKRDESGKLQATPKQGPERIELAEAINEGLQLVDDPVRENGGITLAPDADEMDKESRRFTPQSENFGNTDLVCKPEPLITPADVIKHNPLTFPADVIELPKSEGYLMLDPDHWKKWAIPPSDKIPSVNLPETIGGEIVLPEPPLGMVVAGYAILGGVMLAMPAVEAAASIEVGLEIPAGLIQLLHPMRFVH